MSIALIQLASERARKYRASVGPYDAPVPPQGACKLDMMQALQAAELDMLMSLLLVDDSERDTRKLCGSWASRELLGHLADSNIQYQAWLTELQGGPKPGLPWDDDLDKINAYLVEQRAGQSWTEQWTDFRNSSRSLLDALHDVTDDAFVAPRTGGRYATIYNLAWSAAEHYLEHAAGVRKAYALGVPPCLLEFHGPYTG
jgi:hypothetical protein